MIDFYKSSYSNMDCVAVAHFDDGSVAVRDTKVDDGPVLTFTPAEWDAFVAGVKDGQFDRPDVTAEPSVTAVPSLPS